MPTPDAVEFGVVEDFVLEGGFPASRRRHVVVARRPRIVTVAAARRVVCVDRQRRVVIVMPEV